MNFLPALLGKKGRFGTIWFAAHHPNKLKRFEVVTINLEAKCHEIEKFIVNGKSNMPRFSLFISAHLMYGLVIILNKKISFLLEEFVELRSDLLRPYYVSAKVSDLVLGAAAETLDEVTPRRKARAPMTAVAKAAIEEHMRGVITLKENLPPLFECAEVSLESMLDQMIAQPPVVATVPSAAITMQESFDLYDRSLIIPVEEVSREDFTTDLFGAVPGAAMVDQMLQLGEPSIGRTPAQKPPAAPQPSLARETTTAELETVLEESREQERRRAEAAGMPELYQESFMPPVLEEIIQSAAQPPEPAALPPAPAEVTALVEAPIAPRKPRRRRLGPLIDEVTKFSVAEMNKRIQASDTEVAHATVMSRLERRLELISTELEYTRLNLLKQPLGELARRTENVLSERDLKLYVSARMRNQLGSMQSSRQPDDLFSYLTRRRELAPQEITVVEEQAVSGVELSELERQRRLTESREMGRPSTVGEVRATRRREQPSVSILSPTAEVAEATADVRMRLQFEETMAVMQPEQVTTIFEEAAPPVYELTQMQAIILDYVREKSRLGEEAVLQELIKEKTATQRAKKLFAAQAFYSTLMLLKNMNLNAEQDDMYKPIRLEIAEKS